MGEPEKNRSEALRRLFARHYVLLLLCIGCGSSVLLFSTVRTWQGYWISQQFEDAARDRVAAVKGQVDSNLMVLQTVASLFANSDIASQPDLRQRFRAFVRPYLQQYPSIQALEWVPRLRGKERAVYEAHGVRDGYPGFQITRIGADGRIVRDLEAEEYISVCCVEPYQGNETALGLNSLSDPLRAEAIHRACDTGKPVATAPLSLVQESGSQPGLLVYAPVYMRGAPVESVDQRRENLQGYVVAVFRIGIVVRTALADLTPVGVDTHLFDWSGAEKPRHLHSHWSRLRPDVPVDPPDPAALRAGLHVGLTVDVAGRQWWVVCAPSAHFVTPGGEWQAWVVLAGGLLLTLTFAGSLWRAGRTNSQLVREMAGRRQAEARLVLAGKVLDNSGEAILITDADNNIVSVNQAFAAMTGYSQAEVEGRNPRLLKSGLQDAAFYERMWESIARSGAWQGEVWNRRKNGETIPLWLAIGTIKDERGRTTNHIAIASDMTRRKATEERIRSLAYYDAVTGLPNRTLLKDRLQQAVAHARRSGARVALLFLDLDRFKNINDSLGHRTGDLLLQEVAARLRGLVRESDTVARMGGDEFVIVLPDGSGPTDAAGVAERIQQALAMPFAVDGHQLNVRASIGISVYPNDGRDIDDLMRNADAAMYHCKRHSQSAYQFFTEDMNTRISRRLLVENELRRALHNRELCLHFQPQVNAFSGQIIGAEALVRWLHQQRGLISPVEFIPIAEESGMIVPLGEWVLQEACCWNARWQKQGLGPAIPIAVNVSAMQFRQRNFQETVLQALSSSGLRPEFLELELTESAFVGDADGAAGGLKALKEIGVHLAIDDFGTGYSSLSYLKRFPLDKIKIAQVFVRNLTSDGDDAAIVAATIQMARSLGLEVIAEGVETQEQLALLRERGCGQIQGYLFGKPMPAESFAELLRARMPVAVGG